MFYDFACEKHGLFEVEQPLLSPHEFQCPHCGSQCQRKYNVVQWIWAGNVFREDGSLREQNDYGILKG